MRTSLPSSPNKARFIVQTGCLLLFLLLLQASLLQAQTYSRLTNLPAVYINTFDGSNITSKTVYKYATMTYVDEQDSVTVYDSLQIRGRGNSTWNLSKKPYRIKFAEKEKFLGKGYAKAKKWTLLANAADKTMIRNAITSAMGEFAGLDFNPAYKFVDLYINDTYYGTYQISDQVEVRAHRVNVTEQDYPLTDESNITGGYLLEVDGFFDGNAFYTSTSSVPVRIHYPDEDEIDATQQTYITDYVNTFESTLMGSNFSDPTLGYRPLVDSTSLVNWMLCIEISANIDGYYSSYFYKEQDDPKLYFGPLWDYDIAYYNDTRISGTVKKLMFIDGYGGARKWVTRMWEDPWFAQLACHRYAEMLDSGLVDYMNLQIDSLVNLLSESQARNYEKWGISTKMYHETVLYSSYDAYIDDLRDFISDHTAYLTTAFAAYLDDDSTDGDGEETTDPVADFYPGDYYYNILNNGSLKALSADSTSTLSQYVLSGDSTSQQWRIVPQDDYFVLINRATGESLNDPTEGSVDATTNVGTRLNTAETDLTDERQQWQIVSLDTEGLYNLINRYTSHAMNLAGGSTDDGARIVSYTSDTKNSTSDNRKWQINETAELVEDVDDGDTADGVLSCSEPEDYALAYNSQSRLLHFGADNPADLTFMASVYNVSGQRVARFRASDGCSLQGQPSGIYIVTWHAGGRTISRKLEIK